MSLVSEILRSLLSSYARVLEDLAKGRATSRRCMRVLLLKQGVGATLRLPCSPPATLRKDSDLWLIGMVSVTQLYTSVVYSQVFVLPAVACGRVACYPDSMKGKQGYRGRMLLLLQGMYTCTYCGAWPPGEGVPTNAVPFLTKVTRQTKITS